MTENAWIAVMTFLLTVGLDRVGSSAFTQVCVILTGVFAVTAASRAVLT